MSLFRFLSVRAGVLGEGVRVGEERAKSLVLQDG